MIMWKQCIPTCFSPCCFSSGEAFQHASLSFTAHVSDHPLNMKGKKTEKNITKKKKNTEPLVTGLGAVLGRVLGDGLKDERFTRSDIFGGPKGSQ